VATKVTCRRRIQHAWVTPKPERSSSRFLAVG
jgi:hypothetical protein